ncbi:MAG: hypothetical protein KDB07_11995, partial [Planctomycetes bacterium]|nr:hypothetical protein [Planctomycetota bacterium]
GELYGGVAFAPEVRRLLMTCGGHGMQGMARELELRASKLSADLSELAMRAGLIQEPLDSLEGEALRIAIEGLFTHVTTLAEWVEAKALSPSVKELFDLFAKVREAQREFDLEATTLLALRDCVQAEDALLALLALYIDAKRDPAPARGRPLTETISIAPFFTSQTDNNAVADSFDALVENPHYAAYLASRGGHSEWGLDSAFETTAFGRAWRAEALRLLLVARGQAKKIVVTFVAGPEALETFPAGTLNSTLRIVEGAGEGLPWLRPTLVDSRLRDALARVVRSVYLERESANAGAYRALLRALANHAEAHYAELLEQLESDSVVNAAIAEQTFETWLGSANALAAFVEGRVNFDGAPDDERARRALLAAAYLECPAFRQAFDEVREGLTRWEKRRTSLHCYRRLAKGSFGLVFPAIEKALEEATRGISMVYVEADAPNMHRRAIDDARWLLALAMDEERP